MSNSKAGDCIYNLAIYSHFVLYTFNSCACVIVPARALYGLQSSHKSFICFDVLNRLAHDIFLHYCAYHNFNAHELKEKTKMRVLVLTLFQRP